jgi:hypothetical protein
MSDDTISVDVLGLPELMSKLDDLATNEAKKIVRAGVAAGATEIVKGMTDVAGMAPGEIGELLSQKSSWKKSTRSSRGDDLAATATVRPKGTLPDLHVGTGRGIQPKGNRYYRSLAYLVRLLEFGSSGYKGKRAPVMTAGYEASKGNVLDAIAEKIRERLKL